MPAYAIGLLTDVDFHPEIVAYIRRIDATLAPFGGRFLVHGAVADVKEGVMTSDCVVLQFPSMDNARAWYDSDTYRALIPLRANHSKSVVFLLDGVPEGYRASALLEKSGAT